MSAKFSRWFPPSVHPVHVGVYEVDEGRRHFYALWNGTRFCGRTRLGYADRQPYPSIYSAYGPMPIRWRGLARKPK